MHARRAECVGRLSCSRSASATREHLLRDLKQKNEQLQLRRQLRPCAQMRRGERKSSWLGLARVRAMPNTMVRTLARIPRDLGDSFSSPTGASITTTLQLIASANRWSFLHARERRWRPGPKASLRGLQCVVRVGVRAEQVHTVWRRRGHAAAQHGLSTAQSNAGPVAKKPPCLSVCGFAVPRLKSFLARHI